MTFLWPALAAASASHVAATVAKEFAGLALGPGAARRAPSWTTRNRVALELRTVRLRDFSVGSERPALVCAPFALHDASIVDFAPDHSLVAALIAAGLRRLFVTDWRSADSEMRSFSIDTYLADLNVLVDHVGGKVDLIGLCQGGWMALIYAARFPAKVRKLVLAGAPVDIAAEQSHVSRLAQQTPLAIFKDLIDLGDGRVLGPHALQFWGPPALERSAIQQALQMPESTDAGRVRRLEARFRAWHERTVDLPGVYYLEVIERLFKDNQLATGRFTALGRQIDLSQLRIPIFLLAGRDDELVAPGQVFATERRVGTPARKVQKLIAPCSHLGLFMSQKILSEVWPHIAHWLAASSSRSRRQKEGGREQATAHSRPAEHGIAAADPEKITSGVRRNPATPPDFSG
jgi:poly(3-hydroxybutyrate) depolymerase